MKLINFIYVVFFTFFISVSSHAKIWKPCKAIQNSVSSGEKTASKICYEIKSTPWKACKQRVSGATDAEIVVFKEDAEFYKFRVKSFLGDLNDFDLRLAQIKGLGAVLVVANREQETNGMAVQEWKLQLLTVENALDSSKIQNSEFFIQDYGPGSLVADEKNAKYCQFLKSEWIQKKGKTYLKASLMSWNNKIFIESGKTIEVRYSKSLEKKRLATELDSTWETKHVLYDPLQLL